MNKKTQKKCVALLTLLAMVICTMFYTNTARAEENLPDCPIVKTYTCTVNGTVRTFTCKLTTKNQNICGTIL